MNEKMNSLEIDLENLGYDYKAALKEVKELKETVKHLKVWESKHWNKKPPGINQTVLIQHELGAGINYDVACYMGRNKHGDDIYILSDRTEIIKANVVKWRNLT